MFGRILALASLVTVSSLAPLGGVRQAPADLIVTGGVIYTADDRRPRVDAIAVRDGRFVAVGSAASVAAMRGATTRVVDLAGSTVVPGLQDAHGHFLDHAAITRQDVHGQPPDGWAPAQRLTRREALRSFTLDAAYAAHAESALGWIEAGKLADFVVLSRDIMTVVPADVLDTQVRRTFIGGRQVFPIEP